MSDNKRADIKIPRKQLDFSKNIHEEIREILFELSDEEYRKFSSRLLPGCNNILGVRLPLLRKLAKTIADGNWRNYIDSAANVNERYFEEIMLEGIVIGLLKTEPELLLSYISEFIPRIDNWSVCDSFCTGLKFTKKNKDRVWDFLQPYLDSEKEFEVRFGLVMLLNYYIEDGYIDLILKRIEGLRLEGYYAKMAAAWTVASCYIKYPERTKVFLFANSLDDYTFNKALQKIIESYAVDPVNKTLIKSLKRN